MNIFLYLIIFTMGTLFGSFYTLAVYRIPKKIDIIHTHSFCPNCGHKLGFLELIPIWSYLFLRGKCKKCNNKIRPRYLVLELLSGLVFVLIAHCLKIDSYNLSSTSLIRFGFIVLYLACIFIIAGIDKDERRVEKSVLYYGIIVSCTYIIYLCIIGENNIFNVIQTSIYRYVMYLVTFVILLIIDTEYQIKTAKQNYIIEVFMLIVIMIVNSSEFVTLTSIVVVLISVLLTKMIYYLKNSLNKHKKEHKDLKQIHKFAYLLTIANVILLIGQMRLYY